MDNSFIEELLNHPFEKKRIKSLSGEFWIEEVFTNKNKHIDGEIRCGIQGDVLCNGSVEVYIEIEKFKKEHRAGFGCLEVPSMISNHGIGTTLMLSVIDIIKAFKELFLQNIKYPALFGKTSLANAKLVMAELTKLNEKIKSKVVELKEYSQLLSIEQS